MPPSRMVVLSALALACAFHYGLAGQIHFRSGDPAVDGKDYLLDDAQFRAVLLTARERLAKIAPGKSIHRIHVVGQGRVEAYYGKPPVDDIAVAAYLVLEQTRG